MFTGSVGFHLIYVYDVDDFLLTEQSSELGRTDIPFDKNSIKRFEQVWM